MSTVHHGSATGGAGGRRPIDSLAARVHIMRRELGMTQREAAEAAGLTFGEWQGIEDGREVRRVDVKVGKMAMAFGYDREWLMWGGPLDPGQVDGGGGGMSSDGNSRRYLRPFRTAPRPSAPTWDNLDLAAA